ncbi:hypothetical protein D3C86_2063150 [compost metagenome]
MMTVRNTSIDSAKVTMMWLVTVKKYGTMPNMLANRIKVKRLNTSGKNFMPAVPAELLTMPATNS